MGWLLVGWLGAGWYAAGYLAGALAIALLETDWKREELAGLALWPVTLPLGALTRWWRRRRSTCRVCRRHFGTRDRLRAHLERSHQ